MGEIITYFFNWVLEPLRVRFIMCEIISGFVWPIGNFPLKTLLSGQNRYSAVMPLEGGLGVLKPTQNLGFQLNLFQPGREKGGRLCPLHH